MTINKETSSSYPNDAFEPEDSPDDQRQKQDQSSAETKAEDDESRKNSYQGLEMKADPETSNQDSQL